MTLAEFKVWFDKIHKEMLKYEPDAPISASSIHSLLDTIESGLSKVVDNPHPEWCKEQVSMQSMSLKQ